MKDRSIYQKEIFLNSPSEIVLEFEEIYDLGHTFECGQIFSFESPDYGQTYYGTFQDRVLKIIQLDAHKLKIVSNIEENLSTVVNTFFRTADTYLEIQKILGVDALMVSILETTNGLHLLKQDLFECAIAYLLSQCSNIPRIKNHLNQLRQLYGSKVEFEDQIFHLFPTRAELLLVSEEELRNLGFGYRAKYIAAFIENLPSFFSSPDSTLTGTGLNQALQNIPGVGQKVADCIQLFGFGDLSFFPVDTWMKQFMNFHYGVQHGKEMNTKQIRVLGEKLFGKYAGYAQEFIFHYARCYDTLLLENRKVILKKTRQKKTKSER